MTREFTRRVLDEIKEGILDRDTVILACLNSMSEDDVRDMVEAYELFPTDEADDNDDDGQPDEAQEWHDFDPGC